MSPEGCEDPKKSSKIERLSWDVVENFGDAPSVIDQLHMLGLGSEYKTGERVRVAIRGTFWIQKVENPGKPKTHKNAVIKAAKDADSISPVTELEQGTETVTEPTALETKGAAKGFEPQGKLVAAPLSAKVSYTLTYDWEKCGGPKGTGDLVFAPAK